MAIASPCARNIVFATLEIDRCPGYPVYTRGEDNRIRIDHTNDDYQEDNI